MSELLWSKARLGPYVPNPPETEQYDSWDDFLDEYGGDDESEWHWTILIQWQWLDSDDPDYDELDEDEFAAVFYLPRGNKFIFVRVPVSKDNDESGVREYLEPRAAFMRKCWTL